MDSTKQTILDRLSSVLSPEKLEQLSALDVDMLQPILDAHQTQIADAEKGADLEKQRKAHIKTSYVDDVVMDSEEKAKLQAQLKGMPLWVRMEHQATGNIGKVKMALDGDNLQLRISTPHLIPKILDMIQTELDTAGSEFDALHKPKPKKSSGKRDRCDDWSDDCLIKTNTPETAQGSDNKFFFEGDETSVMLKDGKITEKDGKKVKRQTYRAVRKETPFMPMVEGGCCGAVNWDRSIGSTALADLGIKKGQFRMLCGEKATADGFCSKCAKKKDNFWRGKYKGNIGSYWSVIHGNSNGACGWDIEAIEAKAGQ